jgi:ADP-ribosylglycohydrolase
VIGDALGALIEFMTIDGIRQRYGQAGVTDYVEFDDKKGRFTDDTQMTLFTAEEVIRAIERIKVKGIGGTMINIAHESYLRWLLTQGIHVDSYSNNIKTGWLIRKKGLFIRRAPGNACLSALSSGKYGTIKNPINDSKGCGGIMRMAPVGLAFYDNPPYAFMAGCELAAITHGNPSGYLATGCIASIISCLVLRKSLKEAISETILILKQWEKHEVCLDAIEKAIELAQKNEAIPDKIALLGTGWVGEELLSISLFCALYHLNDFKRAVLASINHGGDSDSTRAITGNLVGLIVGKSKIPTEWIDNLELTNIVEQVGADLYTLDKSRSCELGPDPEWYKMYPA